MNLAVMYLEKRVYSRQEMAELFDLNLADNRHFKRNLERKLQNLGYGYRYSTASVEITHIPTTDVERLKIILIVVFGLDVQTDPYAFSCFLCAFDDIPGFESMPWEERADAFYREYGLSVAARTLSNWCCKLFNESIAAKSEERTFWKTENANGVLVRSPIASDDEKMRQYYEERIALVEELQKEYQKDGLSPKEAWQNAWSEAIHRMWEKYHCCYYSCQTILLGAFSQDDRIILQDIYELSRNIRGELFQQQQKEDGFKF